MHVYTQYVTQLFVCRLGCDVLGTQGFFMFFFCFLETEGQPANTKDKLQKTGEKCAHIKGRGGSWARNTTKSELKPAQRTNQGQPTEDNQLNPHPPSKDNPPPIQEVTAAKTKGPKA